MDTTCQVGTSLCLAIVRVGRLTTFRYSLARF